MNIFKFNDVTVRYYWYTDHKLYFTANSAFTAFGFKGWWNYMQRHGGDFMLPDQSETEYPYTYAVSWDGLRHFPHNCKGHTRSNHWWVDNHLLYEDFMDAVKKFVLHEQSVKQTAAAIDSPACKHNATVAALQSLPKAKLPEPDAESVVCSPTFDAYCAQNTSVAQPRQCPGTVEALFDKVTATLNRHKGGEDSFPRIRDYWNESTEEAVALKMALLKIARIENGISVEDSYVDAIGYLALAYNKFREQEYGQQ